MKLRKIGPLLVSSFFIVLFVYASVNKMMDFENFQVQLAQSPIIESFAISISYGVIIAEILIVSLLCFEVTRQIGLYTAQLLLSFVAFYIGYIMITNKNLPCTCIGPIKGLSWQQNFWLCLLFLLIATSGIAIRKKTNN